MKRTTWLLGLVALHLVACSGVVGEDGKVPASGNDVAFVEDLDEQAPDGAGDAAPDEDGKAPADLTEPPTVSGCVSCHTNKELLVAVAPVEEVTEDTGGG